MATTHVCRVKSGLFKCKAAAVALCQYCGRDFCRRHGEVLADGQEICSRRFCIEKRRDLEQHLVYKAAVQEQNEAGSCGVAGCRSSLSEQCERCRGFFCGRHVESRSELVLENQVRVPRMAALCSHCWKRRPIWTRT